MLYSVVRIRECLECSRQHLLDIYLMSFRNAFLHCVAESGKHASIRLQACPRSKQLNRPGTHLFAHEYHLCCLVQLMVRCFRMTLATVEPSLTTRRSDGDLSTDKIPLRHQSVHLFHSTHTFNYRQLACAFKTCLHMLPIYKVQRLQSTCGGRYKASL